MPFFNMHRVDGVKIEFARNRSIPEGWAQLLNAYEDALNPRNIPAKKGPFSHRSRVGPLDFGKSIDVRKGGVADGAEIGVLFELTLYFRRYTSGVDADRLGYMQTGEPMPQSGDPCWPLVVQLMAATFDKDAFGTDGAPEEQNVRRRFNKLLKEHPQLTFAGWPPAPAE